MKYIKRREWMPITVVRISCGPKGEVIPIYADGVMGDPIPGMRAFPSHVTYTVADVDEDGLEIIEREPEIPEWARYCCWKGFDECYSTAFMPVDGDYGWKRIEDFDPKPGIVPTRQQRIEELEAQLAKAREAFLEIQTLVNRVGNQPRWVSALEELRAALQPQEDKP